MPDVSSVMVASPAFSWTVFTFLPLMVEKTFWPVSPHPAVKQTKAVQITRVFIEWALRRVVSVERAVKVYNG